MANNQLCDHPGYAEGDINKPVEDRAARVKQCFTVGQASEGSTAVKTDDSYDTETGEVNWGRDRKQDE